MINNRSGFLAAFTAMLLSTTALADTSSLSTATSGMGVLENDYVKAGVRAEFDISDFTLTGQASYSTDKYLVASAGVSYNITENSSVGITFNKLSHEDTDIKSLGAELNIKF